MPADPITLARDLLRCPSVTPREGGALIFLRKILASAGFAVHRIVFSEPGADDVENLYARIGTTGPHLVLAGHTDVVPPGDEAHWRHRPFAGEIADGVLFGRGAVDMKGAIACELAAVLDQPAANGGKGKGPISLLLTPQREGVARHRAPEAVRGGPCQAEAVRHRRFR